MTTNSSQQLILIISRYNLNSNMIPPFKIIIPTLQLISSLRLFTSMGKEILTTNLNPLGGTFSNLYQALVYHLQNQQGQVDLSSTLNKIYNQKLEQQRQQKNNNIESSLIWKFRICILGEQIISWDIVMKYKLKNIVIDTVGQNKRLQQISFATGGINKSTLLNQNIIKLFMTIFSLSTQCRKKFNFLALSKEGGEGTSSQSIQFTVDCICCGLSCKQLSNQCYLCSKCLAIHCSSINQRCKQCGSALQVMNISQKPC